MRSWNDLADRIWHEGILREAPLEGTGPGLIDAETGRFLDARRLSTRRGFWTDRADWTIERSQAIDISLLGAAFPFDLLPAADARIGRFRPSALETQRRQRRATLARPLGLAARPCRSQRPPTAAHRQDPSSLATLWMVRYLLKLGRETGDARHWNRAATMLDAVLGRLCPLGLSMRLPARRADGLSLAPRPGGGVWGLHTMLIESLLDFAGLDFDAAADTFLFEPALPADWPSIGFEQPFARGKVSYRLDRDGSNSYRLVVDADLTRETAFARRPDLSGASRPRRIGLADQAPGDTAPPEFDEFIGRLRWTTLLPAGKSSTQWTWGGSSNGRETPFFHVETASR